MEVWQSPAYCTCLENRRVEMLRGFESHRFRQKESSMKTMTFKNRFNGEIVVCNDVKTVQVIDGVEYLLVSRKIQDRKFLMRKDALEKIKDKMPL